MIARRPPDVGAVCAFGQLIADPLLSELEMLNVHPSLLPRWRGAAPIERAILAGRRGDRRDDPAGHRGSRLGPGRLREPTPIGPGDDLGALEPRLAELGGELLVRAMDLRAAGELELTEQDEAPPPTPRRSTAAERRLDPARPAAELERRVRALNPHIGDVPRARRGERLGVRRARVAHGGARAGRASRPPASACCSAAATGALELLEVQAPGKKPMAADGYLRGHAPPARARLTSPARRRRLRGPAPRVRGRRLGRPRAAGRAGAPRRVEPRTRPRAAARLRRRPAPWHLGPPDRALARPAARELDDPVLAALRLGLFELLFSERRAARRRRRGGRARQGEPARAPRRRARERGAAAGRPRGRRSCSRGLDARRRARPPLAHSYPPWLAELWWEELGPRDGARADGGAERARRDGAAGERAARRPRGAPRGAARRRRGRRAGAGARAPRRPRVDRRRMALWASAGGCGARARAALVGQSRVLGRRASTCSTREPGERVLDLCAGPGVKTTMIAARMRNEGAIRVGRAATPARRDGGRARRAAGGDDRRGRRGATRPLTTWARATIASWWIRRARTSERSPRAPTRAGARSRGIPLAWPRSRARSSPAAPPPCARAARSSTRPARSRRARTRRSSTPSSRARRRARPARRRARRALPRAGLATAIRASSRSGPTATAPTGSSSPGCRRDELTAPDRAPAPELPRLRRAMAAPDQPARALPVRELPAPLRAGLGLPGLRRAPDDRPHALDRGHALPALRQLDAEVG